MGAFNSRVFDIGEFLLTIEHLDTVLVVPVACDDHLSIIHLQTSGKRPFQVHATKAVEGVGDGIVKFCQMSLADADRLITASSQQHLSRFQYNGETDIMVVDHLQLIPFAIAIVFCCGGWHEAIGMTASHDELTVDIE